MESPEEKYGSKTVEELKAEFRRRKAALWGRKKELIERLVVYDRNKNFGVVPVEEPEQVELIKTPPRHLYKDIRLSSPIPKLTDEHIVQYMGLFEKDVHVGSSKEMYKNGYLRYLRFCIDQDGLYYVTSKCEAQMKKHCTYDVHVSLFLEGEIHESSCECVAGRNKHAHCKHVCITLYGIRDIYNKNPPILRQTSTQKIQKFHRPTKKYSGSPLTAKAMKKFRKDGSNSKSKQVENSSENGDSLDDDIRYRDFFQNVIKNRCRNSEMSLKHLTEPANLYGVVLDHDYLKYHPEYEVLKQLYLIDVSLGDVERIELSTLDQSDSREWLFQRKIRITASRFYDICQDQTDKEFKDKVSSILRPKKFNSKQTAHGKTYESVAIEQFEKFMLLGQMKVEKCGLMIMKQYPFLGASPDGILAELTVVEVKCHYSSRYAIANEVTVECLYKDAKGNLHLKEDHEYYYQVQGQLMVTGRLFCDFLVYTFKSLVRITVNRNDELISEMLGKLITFYEKYLQPAILQKYLYRGYESIFTEQADEIQSS